MKDLESQLTKTGNLFDDRRQSAIYLSLLRQGEVGVEALRKDTGIHSETIQRELKKMVKKQTVSIIHKGRNKKIKATPLSQLQEILENNINQFDFLLKPLLEVSAEAQQPKVQIFLGEHNFGMLQIKLLKLQPEAHNIDVISTQPKNWREAMINSGKLDQFEKLRLKKEINFNLSCFSSNRGEVEHNNRQFFPDQPQALKRKYRYVESSDSPPLQIQIWQNTIVISIFSAQPSIHMVFEDKNMKKAMKAYFNVLWEIGIP